MLPTAPLAVDDCGEGRMEAGTFQVAESVPFAVVVKGFKGAGTDTVKQVLGFGCCQFQDYFGNLRGDWLL